MVAPVTKGTRKITIRIPRKILDEVRRIAESDAESQCGVIRRLLRVGLTKERRDAGVAA